MLFAAPRVVIRMPSLGVGLKGGIHKWTQLIHRSASVSFFPSFVYLCVAVGWVVAEDNLRNRFSLPPYHELNSSQSQQQASTHLLSCLTRQGVAFLAFQTLALQLQTSHVLESRLRYHRPNPLPLTSRSTASDLLWRKHLLNAAEASFCVTAIAAPPPH